MAGLVPFVVPPDADAPIRRALYRAPERADEASESAAGDVYAVGVLLYEALTGHPPFTGADPAEITAQHRVVRPAPILAPVQAQAQAPGSAPAYADHPLWPLIAACLEKNPHDRPAAASWPSSSPSRPPRRQHRGRHRSRQPRCPSWQPTGTPPRSRDDWPGSRGRG